MVADNAAATSLHSAILNNDFERVQQFIKEEADLNSPNVEGLKPLHVAISKNNQKIAKLLLDCDSVELDMSAWIYAIMLNNKDMFDLIIDESYEFNFSNARNSQGETLVHYVVKYRSFQILERCEKFKEIINNVDNSGYSALHLAIIHNDVKMINILLQKGANVYAKTTDGRSSVHLAVQHQCFDTLTMLIEANVDVNDPVTSTGEHLLHIAVRNDDVSTVNLLIRSGGNLHCEDNEGKTLLHVAVGCKNEEMLKLLLKKKLNVNARFGEEQESVLDLALRTGNSQIITTVLNYNPDLNSKNTNGLSAIFIALTYKKFVNEIFSLKPDLDNETNSGDSLLHYALKFNHEDIVNYLIKNNISIQKVNNTGETALHTAAQYGNAQQLSQLLQLANLDVNAKTKDGNTPLHCAMLNSESVVSIVKILLNSGAKVNAENIQKRTPAFLINYFRKEVLELLLDCGADLNHFDIKGNGIAWVMNLNVDEFFFLVEKNINFKKVNINNDSIFHVMAKRNVFDKTLIEKFLTIGVRINGVNNNNQTPLNVCLENNANPEFVIYFIDYKGAIANKNKEGESPLHLAIKWQQYETVVLLLENRTELNSITANGSTILHYAVEYNIKSERLDFLKLLFEYDLDNIINSQNNDGRTALHLAALKNSLEMVETLSNNDIDINVKDLKDNSALCYAIGNKNLSMVKFLLKKGASTKDLHRGMSIYDLAKECGDKHIYQMVLLF